MTTVPISLTVNGRRVDTNVDPRSHLADFLREGKLLTGTHLGCEQGVCGACTLMVDGRPVRSCITYVAAVDGCDVRTVEGFADDALMTRIRRAFSEHHGLQCGFCTPGMLATAYDIVRRLPDADELRIRKELAGNLCRCTGYAGIVEAIKDVLANDVPTAALLPMPRRARTQALGETVAAAPERAADSPGGAPMALDVDAEIDGQTLMRSLLIDAPVDAVWAVVSDVPSVVACIPGASLDGTPEGDVFSGVCAVAVGPMRANFKGQAAVRFDAASRTGRVVGKGKDGLTRSNVDGALDFALAADGTNGSRLNLEMTYKLQGPLAQFGRKALVEEIADRILSDVSARLAARATGAKPPQQSEKPLNGLTLAFSVIKRLLVRIFK